MMEDAAQNIANVNTEPYQPRETVMSDRATGGVSAVTLRSQSADRVDLSKEAVDLMIAEFGIRMNARVLTLRLVPGVPNSYGEHVDAQHQSPFLALVRASLG